MKKMLILIALLATVAVAGALGWKNWKPLTPSQASAATCSHGLEDAKCPFCHSDLVEKEGMCGEHGVPEAMCWICRPKLLAVYKATEDWCKEHNRPESFCITCHPQLAETKPYLVETEAAPAEPHDHDHAHTEGDGHDHSSGKVQLVVDDEMPRSQRSPSVSCANSKTIVRFASLDAARSAAMETAVIERRPVSQTLRCNAEIAYNGNLYARLSSRAAGIVKEVRRDAGAKVPAGDVMATVDSAEAAAAKGAYLQSLALLNLWEKNHAVTHDLMERGAAASWEDRQSEAELAEKTITVSQATQRLQTLGLSTAQIQQIKEKQDTSPLVEITAPFDGEIVERSAVIGEMVQSGQTLFAVADTSKVWANLDVYEADVGQAKVGQQVILSIDGLRGQTFPGEITWISMQLDSRTRTLRVRAELSNVEGMLRSNMFGRAVITVHERQPLLIVPKAAVQWDGCCNIAFVRVNDVTYRPRQLRLGYETEDYFEVQEGLSEGEIVVTQGSFLLKTEIMKSSIGAGCCEAGGKKG